MSVYVNKSSETQNKKLGIWECAVGLMTWSYLQVSSTGGAQLKRSEAVDKQE